MFDSKPGSPFLSCKSCITKERRMDWMEWAQRKLVGSSVDRRCCSIRTPCPGSTRSFKEKWILYFSKSVFTIFCSPPQFLYICTYAQTVINCEHTWINFVIHYGYICMFLCLCYSQISQIQTLFNLVSRNSIFFVSLIVLNYLSSPRIYF